MSKQILSANGHNSALLTPLKKQHCNDEIGCLFNSVVIVLNSSEQHVAQMFFMLMPDTPSEKLTKQIKIVKVSQHLVKIVIKLFCLCTRVFTVHEHCFTLDCGMPSSCSQAKCASPALTTACLANCSRIFTEEFVMLSFLLRASKVASWKWRNKTENEFRKWGLDATATSRKDTLFIIISKHSNAHSLWFYAKCLIEAVKSFHCLCVCGRLQKQRRKNEKSTVEMKPVSI